MKAISFLILVLMMSGCGLDDAPEKKGAPKGAASSTESKESVAAKQEGKEQATKEQATKEQSTKEDPPETKETQQEAKPELKVEAAPPLPAPIEVPPLPPVVALPAEVEAPVTPVPEKPSVSANEAEQIYSDEELRVKFPLQALAARGDVDGVRAFVQKFCNTSHNPWWEIGHLWSTHNINSQDKQGRTALHLAAIGNYPEVAQVLLTCPSVLLEVLDAEQKTPLMNAAERRHYSVGYEILKTAQDRRIYLRFMNRLN